MGTFCALLQGVVFFAFFSRNSFWMDEILSLEFIEGGAGAMLEHLAGDVHPPGFFVALAGWRALVPETEPWLRLLPLGLSLACLPMLYGLAARVWGVSAAGWACLLVSLSPFQAQFAAELRMYTAFEALALGATGLLLAAVGTASRVRSRWLIGAYAVVALAMMYTHYYGVFVLAAHGVGLALMGRGRQWPMWLVAYGVVAMGFAPWGWVVFGQLAGGGGEWIESVQTGTSWIFLLHTLYYFHLGEWAPPTDAFGSLAMLFVVGPVLVAGLWKAANRAWSASAGRAEPPMVMALVALFPMYAILTVSFVKPMYMSRYVIPSLPFVFAIAGLAIGTLRRAWWRRTVGGLFCAALIYGIFGAAGRAPREDWRAVARYIETAAGQAVPGAMGFYCDDRLTATCTGYYLERLGPEPGPDVEPLGRGGWTALREGRLAENLVVVLRGGITPLIRRPAEVLGPYVIVNRMWASGELHVVLLRR